MLHRAVYKNVNDQGDHSTCNNFTRNVPVCTFRSAQAPHGLNIFRVERRTVTINLSLAKADHNRPVMYKRPGNTLRKSETYK